MMQILCMSNGQRMAANQGIRAGKGFTGAIFGKLKFLKKLFLCLQKYQAYILNGLLNPVD